ncbi:cilia- and flagella-associated protein 47 isoform X2 [Coturnix japonica]|uniref:cilia- and flagella-associated protein 47 isoform X2 n=1 Tax=Coturnix japonica TaxID=93934 RepID=UPI0013A5CD04|nr:cilia- and flagella-associated protein 47 isoform X2 [Coturnix japonica]
MAAMSDGWWDVDGVRITPPELLFTAAVPGRRYRAALSVRNLRVESCRLRLLPPCRPEFKLTVENPEHPVAPGLQIKAFVEYCPETEQDLEDSLRLLIEEDIVDIPLIGLAPCCYLETKTEVDFGTVMASGKVISEEISIANHGSASGSFKISYNGDILVGIEPTSGVVEPESFKVVKVQICTDVPRIINEMIKVEGEGGFYMEVQIKAVVVEQVLRVLGGPSGNVLECINFGSVYFGSSKTEQIYLYNDSPESMDWVAVLDDNAAGGEMGTDLQKSADAVLQDLSFINKTRDLDVSTLIWCIPDQGTLPPYRKSMVTLCFCPKKFKGAFIANDSSPKQDYIVFLRFEAAGKKDLQTPSDGTTPNTKNRPNCTELAVTGTALPVMLTFNPGPVIKFMDCFLGEQRQVLWTLKNESESLPVKFSFRKTAHFNISPDKGKIKKSSTKDFIFSFSPHQIGIFEVKQVIDIIGTELDKNNLKVSKTKSIHQIYLDLIGVCKSKPKTIIFRMNPGITPMITNATGQFVADDTGQCARTAPMAILKSTQTGIHTHQINRNFKGDALIAFPNDRSTSIRPSERNKKYRTIFTKTERYNYIDPEFSYTDSELLSKEAHKEYYADFISSLRQRRLQKDVTRQFHIYDNFVSLDLKTAERLMSPKISVTDFPKEKLQLKMLSSNENCLLTSQKLAESASIEEIWSGLNSVPSSIQEKDDCNLTLTPKQLHQILVGPSTMNFGDVCVCSTTARKLQIINNLLVHIWIQVEIEADELTVAGPLHQVVPPLTKTHFPVEFKSKICGIFKKTFTYTINNKHPGRVLVTANVVPVELHLSERELILNPIPGYLAETEFRATVRVYNPRNCTACFTWKPLSTEKGTAFSIKPTKGFVDPYSDLECEVVWHPGFSSAEEGEFDLCVCKGNTTKLKCFAKLGPTKVQFMEQRVPFSHCPLVLLTCKTATLQNRGYNHAYFQVLDSSPVPGMVITPSEGVVPVGGCADLKFSFIPNSKMNFDTRVEVAIRNAGVLTLRISGFVEIPEINIDVNEGHACTKVLFDFMNCQDFKLNVNNQTDVSSLSSRPYSHSVTLEGKSSLQCSLSFTPKEVAAYEFILPVNLCWYDLQWQQELFASVTSLESEKHGIAQESERLTVPIPICIVKAVVLKSPLELSSMEFKFTRHSSGLNIPDESMDSQKLDLKNISRQQLTWNLTCDDTGKNIKDSVFKFSQQSGFLDPGQKVSITVSFCSSCPGTYASEMSVCVNNNPSHYKVTLSGTVKSPTIRFDPPFLMLMPVPLGVKTEMAFKIIPQDYLSKSRIRVELPDLDLGDGISPFSMWFPDGQDILLSSDGTNKELICHISFTSSSPVSFLGNIYFTDNDENRFLLRVAVTAENCLLTIHSYLALCRSEQQITLISNKDGSSGEVVLHPFCSPQSLSHSSSSTSFSPADVICGSWSGLTLERPETPTSAEMTEESEADSQSNGREYESDLPFFSHEDKEIIFQKTVTAVQNWFTLFGWSTGPNPVSVPHSLRRDVCKVQMISSQEKALKKNLDKGTKTIYDMLFHLSGQLLPGITLNQSLPLDPVERMIQLYGQHSTLLTFLKSQGASLPHVMPEHLFEPEDYKKWIKMQAVLQARATNLKNGVKKNLVIFSNKELLILEDNVFETISKRAWTDVLLQVYKVFVLPRVSSFNTADLINLENMQNMPRINLELLSSNIYSSHERIVLTWLNKNYENNRNTVWKDAQKGKVPLRRWIVNFDQDLLDGLVLAAQVAAYCPFLIASHFVRMYTYPRNPAQFMHNCLILVDAMHVLSLTIDIKATDICDPNPIMMLMLCVYLYENLPYFLPKKTIEFTGALHATVVKQVRLKNPSVKTLTYNATLVGRDADDFSLPEGNTIIIAPKKQTTITVEFTSRFLHPAEAVLLLMSKRMSGIRGATLAFSLKSEVKHIKPAETLKCKSPCYELKKVVLNVTNPFRDDGIFRVILLESTSYLCQPEQVHQARQLKEEQMLSSENNVLNCKKIMLQEEPNEDKNFNCSDQSSFLPEFFSPLEKLFLAGRSCAALEIHFLPFNLEKRYCTVILVNEMIGELVYLVEGTGDIPLPSELLPMDSPNVLRVSSTLEASSTAEPILYLKCRIGQTLEEKLRIPLINESKERALAIAAQQQMSTIEYDRRKLTGTLDSSSVRAATALLGLSRIERYELLKPRKFHPELKSVNYSVQVSTKEFFVVPEKLSIPILASSRVNLKGPSEKVFSPEKIGRSDAVELPIKFIPPGVGCYPCQILLKSSWDFRVYVLKCIVTADGVEAEIEFLTPAYQEVIQNIPIRNMSSQDWKLEAVLEGQGFSGPPSINVGPGEIALYPLTFKPIAKCLTMGRLILQNTTAGIESIFNLKGIGKKPLAQDHIVIDCQVKEVIRRLLWVPNYTKKRLTYKVFSDLSIVRGAPVHTVDPGDIVPYIVSVTPWRRGVFQGVISFVAEDEDQQQSQHNSLLNRTDGELAFKKRSTKTSQTVGAANAGGSSSNCQVWFSLNINSIPGEPERVIDVKWRALDIIGIRIPVTNPTNKVLELNVVLENQCFSGPKTFYLLPKQSHFYQVQFSPAAVGTSLESVIFQSEVVGEFWYALKLTVEKPLPMDLPEIVCELGKWVQSYIPLFNPTHETLKLEIANSNPSNFAIETDPKHELIVAPHSITGVPVKFYPSALGRGNHKASITFKCSQVEEWVFYLSGTGLPPQLMEPTTMSAYIGQGSSVIITFKNPTSENVLVDVTLTDKEQSGCYLSASVLNKSTSRESAFHLFLKNTRGNRLAPKEKLDIPVFFIPDTMKMYEAVMVIHVMKENGENWPYEDSAELNNDLKSVTISEDGGIQGILWTYPIHGIPEAPHQNLEPAVVRCQARERVVKEVEVPLTGVIPGATATFTTRNSEKVIGNKPSNIREVVQGTYGFSATVEFQYELQYQSDEIKSQLEPLVGVHLIQRERDAESGIMKLIFNIVFAPNKPMRNEGTLVVHCTRGGIWKFPLLFIATEPEVDDVINIEAIGLNKESVVEFKLTSQTRYPEPFTAYFLAGSDPDFVVLPQAGELLPVGTGGTHITVGFKPRMYGKKHKATLVIQTQSMQWTYEINGLLPQTVPPTSPAKVVSTNSYIRSTTVRQRNFIHENLKLTTTGVSSPIKGAPLILRRK